MNFPRFRSLLLGSGALFVGALSLVGTVPALADTSTVSQAVTAGILTASVASASLNSVPASHVDQTSSGVLTLVADDSTGSAQGWNVTLQATTPFVYSGSYTNANIPLANLLLVSATLPTLVAGQPVNATTATGPEITLVTPGSLSSARKVVQATAAYGSGAYSQTVNVGLVIPGNSRPGTYTGTLTTTISTAP